MEQYQSVREDIARFMRRLDRQNLTTTSGGNISCRCSDGSIAITASQADKGEQSPENIGIVSFDGTNLTPHLKLSIETAMHLAIYAVRPDIFAIVHAHPVTASFFSAAADCPLDMHITAEAYAVAGEVVFIPYALMGTPRLAELTAQKMQDHNCGLLENHGVITVGKSLLEAFDRMELLECAAKQTLMAQTIACRRLDDARLREIDRMTGRIK